MGYKVKEIYYTLQGEGAQAGRPAVFCRFSGCNLWSGREEDRHKAICPFCDTDFRGVDGVNGGVYADPDELAKTIASLWPNSDHSGTPLVVCTGGEPLLQLDVPLVEAFHRVKFEVAIETNGTIPVPAGVDWVCMSPKAGTEIVVTKGDELKLVYPQAAANPDAFTSLDFRHFFLQPMDNTNQQENIEKTMAYCLANPRWRLSLQLHKVLHIP